VSYGQTVRRSGAYNRLAEPSWADPLDTSYSKREGGRWNPPGIFGALYLNRDVRMALLQVQHKLADYPYDVEDLDPSEQHDLVEVQVGDCDPLDCVTADGLQAVGLTDHFPLDDDDPLPHWICQEIAVAAYQENLPGVACRSAATDATSTDEELAVFDHEVGLVTQTGRRPFSDWYLGA
jgi:hypothetical protein